MRKGIISFFVITMILLLASVSGAQSVITSSDAQTYIDSRIERCRLKAERINSPSEAIREAAQMAKEEANFYEAHKERLAQLMTEYNIGTKQYNADFFLIKAYRDNENVGLAKTKARALGDEFQPVKSQ